MLFKSLAHDGDRLLVNEAGNRFLHHALVVAQLGTDVKEIQRIQSGGLCVQ